MTKTMTKTTGLAITGLGAFTSVGLDVPQTMGAFRAGLDMFQEIDYLGPDRQALVAAPSILHEDGLLGEERIVALGAHALAECAAGHQEEKAPVLLCCRDAAAAKSAGRLLDLVAATAPVRLDGELSAGFDGDHAAVVPALQRARELLEGGQATACYVGGIDCLLDPIRLEWLMIADRLKYADNSDAFIPGEAAAFLRLELPRPDVKAPVVAGLGLATAEATRTSGQPTQGRALAAAMRAALNEAGLPMGEIAMLATDLSGERFGFNEHALARVRLRATGRTDPLPTWSPAESTGEVGTATGPLSLAYLAFMLSAGGTQGAPVMFATSGDGELRGAVVLTAGSQP